MMAKKDSNMKNAYFETGGYVVEITAEQETPHNPLIFIEMFEEGRGLLSINIATDPKSLRKIAGQFLKAADRSERKIQEFQQEKF